MQPGNAIAFSEVVGEGAAYACTGIAIGEIVLLRILAVATAQKQLKDERKRIIIRMKAEHGLESILAH